MYELVVQSGKHAGKRLILPLGKELLVGREPGCQLILNSSLVSRRHCRLQHTAEGIWVTDLGSQNGTYVNDVAVESPTLMHAGDVLRIGASTFQVQATQPAVPAQPVSASAPSGAAAAKSKAMDDTGISDAEIASWLTDHETPISSDDTAIIPKVKPHSQPPSAPPAGTPAPPKPSVSVAAPVKKFKSVKEEAADIIRRHWAKVKGERSAPNDGDS